MRLLQLGTFLAIAVFVVGGAHARQDQAPRLNLSVDPGVAGTVSTSDGRVRCDDLCRTSYRHGTVVTVSAKPAPHYRFDRWFGDCIGVAPICAVALDRDTFARAKFLGEPVELVVSVGGSEKVTSDPAGIDCGGAGYLCRIEVPYGSPVTLTPVPVSTGRFAGWDGPCAAFGTGTCYLRAESMRTETAAAFGHPAPTPGPQPLTVTLFDSLVHVTTIPAGIDCPPTCTASFASGTVVTLYRGNRGLWQPACRGEELDRCAIVVDAPTQVGVAPPAPPPPPLPPRPPRAEVLVTVSRGGSGLVTFSDGTIRCGWSPQPQFFCRDIVTFGARRKKVVRLRTRARARARFARWGGACRGTKPTCRLEILRTGREFDRYLVTGLFRRSSRR
jgi:hypothetical protein